MTRSGRTIETIDQLLETATERHLAGDLAAARRLYAELLAAVPEHTVALFRSGLVELHDGHPQEALVPLTRAAAAAPDESRYQFGLGQALQTLGRWEEAIARYESTVRLEPDFHEAWNNLGNCRQLNRQVPQAVAAYRRALELRPGNPGVIANLGTALRERGEWEEAVELLSAAADLEPLVASHRVNLAMALCQQGSFAAAEALLRTVLSSDANDAEAAFNLGNALHGLGRWREAVDSYQRVVALRPTHAEALNNLGNAHVELGEFAAGLAAYDAAITVRPHFVTALNNAGCLLRTLGRMDEAETMLRRGIDADPRNAALHDNLGSVLKDAGELDAAVESFRTALAIDPDRAATHGNLAYALSFQSPHAGPILEECVRWSERFAVPQRPQIRAYPNDRAPNRRLKIGYVSPDFRDHCQSLFTLPLFSNHDRERFEIFCYASVKRPDGHTRRIAECVDVWRDVRLLDDAALSAVIRNDGIDVLIDLTMHMAGGRPLAFARRPAPVQIAWLAYPGTTGMDAMDYRLSDPRLDPPGFDGHYRERTLRLPDSFWCYDPLAEQPDVNLLPALDRGYLTLGCLNNPCKLTPHTLRLWGGVMRALPGAKLSLMAPPGRHRDRLLARLAAHDIAADRVDFLAFRPRAQYLRSYHDIDLGLDTFPYNGHTTSLDSLWMGVPVVTRVGDTCAGRGGLSQLFQLGLTDLAAATDEAFIRTAVALGNDLARLAKLRAELRTRLQRSPLMNASRFARNIENAYRRAWQAYSKLTPTA